MYWLFHATALLAAAQGSSNANCTSASLLADTDLCPGYPGYLTAEVPAATAAAACAALCCGQPSFCAAWVTRTVAVDAGNCSAGSACCWTKPPCSAPPVPSPGATAGTVRRPPGPPGPPPFAPGFIDSAAWVGTAYAPARAANTLWWARFPEYEADVARELGAARRALALPSLRVFLHTLAFRAAGPVLHAQYVERFLAIAAANGIRVGFVLFGDGWNHGEGLPHAGNTGANVSCAADGSECCARQRDGSVGVKGCSNGCWFANPQDHQRGTVGRDFDDAGVTNASYIEAAFRPYVEAVVAPHATDRRVLFWEAYNEPCEWRHYAARICTRFQVRSSALIKAGAYAWVKALRPVQPVQSCWAERNNTASDLLAVHMYSSNFAAWNAQAFAECAPNATNATVQCGRGAVVTEAGARWFEGMAADAGSPLTVLNWLEALRRGIAPSAAAAPAAGFPRGGSHHSAAASASAYPFVPGVYLAWELMVGNSNTRWASGPPCVASPLAREPPIPWCGLLWPDGTPVSFTEAARLRQYNGGAVSGKAGSGANAVAPSAAFFFFDDFLAAAPDLPGDHALNLTAAAAAAAAGGFNFNFSAPAAGGALVELSFWLGGGGAAAGGEAMHPAAAAAAAAFTVGLSSLAPGSGGDVQASWFLAVSAAAVTLLRASSASGGAQVEVGRIDAASLECGIAVGAWNLLRVRLTPQDLGGDAQAERAEVFLNPLAHATTPDLGRVLPLLNVSAAAVAAAPEEVVTRAVSLLLPPAAGGGVVLIDYVSALPANGGIADD